MLQPNWTKSRSEMVLLLVPYNVCSRIGWHSQDCTETLSETGRIIHEKSPLLLLLPDLKSSSTNNYLWYPGISTFVWDGN